MTSPLEPLRIPPSVRVDISQFDPRNREILPGDREEVEELTERLQIRIGELQELLYAEQKQRFLVVLQGMDTSGKDGVVRKVMSEASPLGVRVASFKKPTEIELAHDYLWRVHAQVPANGEIAIFNRSHYEDVLVVRVRSLVPETTWRRRYAQINDFERMLTESGTTIVKFFLHISAEEQKERLQARLDDPAKQWKFHPGDLAERELWGAYMEAYSEMLSLTSSTDAPWYVVPSDRKWVRNYVIASILVDRLESLGMRYPAPDLTGITID